MKVVLACYGTRGDVEPCVAIGGELLRRALAGASRSTFQPKRFAASAAALAVTVLARTFTNCRCFGTTCYRHIVSKSRRTAAKRCRRIFFLPSGGSADRSTPCGHTRQGSRFNAAAVTCNLETLFEQMYRRYRARPATGHLMVEHRAPAPHAASSAELCS